MAISNLFGKILGFDNSQKVQPPPAAIQNVVNAPLQNTAAPTEPISTDTPMQEMGKSSGDLAAPATPAAPTPSPEPPDAVAKEVADSVAAQLGGAPTSAPVTSDTPSVPESSDTVHAPALPPEMLSANTPPADASAPAASPGLDGASSAAPVVSADPSAAVLPSGTEAPTSPTEGTDASAPMMTANSPDAVVDTTVATTDSLIDSASPESSPAETPTTDAHPEPLVTSNPIVQTSEPVSVDTPSPLTAHPLDTTPAPTVPTPEEPAMPMPAVSLDTSTPSVDVSTPAVAEPTLSEPAVSESPTVDVSTPVVATEPVTAQPVVMESPAAASPSTAMPVVTTDPIGITEPTPPAPSAEGVLVPAAMPTQEPAATAAPVAENPAKAKSIQYVSIFGYSNTKEGDELFNSVVGVSKTLAEAGYTIVDGGGPGVMKAATYGAKSVGGKVIGVTLYPEDMVNFEGRDAQNLFDEEIRTSNYVDRTTTLLKQGQVYVIFNGGTGTVSEFGMAWGLARLYFGHHKPLLLYGKFWEKIIEAFKENMLLRPEELKVFKIVNSPEEVMAAIKEFEAEIQRGEHDHNLKATKSDFMLY